MKYAVKVRRPRLAPLALILCVSLTALASPVPDNKRKDETRKLPFDPTEE